MPGVTVTLTNAGTGLVRVGRDRPRASTPRRRCRPAATSVKAELPGFKTVNGPRHRPRRRSAHAHQRAARGRRGRGVGDRHRLRRRSCRPPSSELGTTVQEEQIKMLPLNGRNFVNLTRTVPGVVRGIPGANIDGAGSLAWRASASFSANGQRPRDNNYMLDGVDNNETWLQTVVLFPSVDALDEFKLQTSTYSAEFGRSLGGVVNLQIKSGTNAMHGSVFEFLRNDAFDANNFFNNRAGRAKPDFSQHQFGGTIGGPIVKDKTFYFFDYQGYRVNQGADLPVDGAVGADASGRLLRAQPRHLRPASPVSRSPATQIPQRALGSGGEEHPRPADSRVEHRRHAQRHRADDQQLPDQPDARAAGQPVRRQGRSQADDEQPASSPATATRRRTASCRRRCRTATPDSPSAPATATSRRRAWRSTTPTRSASNWLNEFRFGWSSIKFFMTPIDYGTNIAQTVGIPGVNLGETTSAMSQIMFNNGGMRNIGANGNQPLITNQNDFQFFDNVTRVAGKHTIKAGGSLTLRSREILNADTIVGRFDFNQNLTSNCAGITAGCTVAGEHRLRLRQLPARLRQQRQPDVVRPGHLHRNAARVRALLPGRHPRDQPPDGERRPAVGRVRAVGRGGRQAVELRRVDRPVRRRVARTR